MPRNNKTSLIQKIASQAYATFTNCSSSAIEDNNKVFLEHQADLVALLSDIRAADLKIAPPTKVSTSSPSVPPVTYMHICETDVFSMGVFLLKSGASIPLHDHPGMHGMLKVLYGKVSIRCYDKLDKAESDTERHFDPPLLAFQGDDVRRAALRSSGQFSELSGPCVLSPFKDNLHEIDAVDGAAAFLDILAPPYDPDDGRDCHYYRVLQTAGKKSEQSGDDEAWLLEIPQPDDFWCGGEPYPGPEVTI
ncbi:2-aminoethanethiol (cysteamine) dioxygenase a [Danio rerio]|uniref:2-aminoethanethiol (Cysteamine) dioxygenase a n=1 Tax=Danio rerio TaxID=7955 RepID=Q5PRD3_DANRE|nr:2-aminoethanethiol (cysteamine) dioxygenase a [Danio rerio]AAH86706.1 2-aminoethanethiol (cysteamine) dioxygenase a [Danio rerio]|eukprot:NP_001008634.1 2-aminoethanethiol (cysteamine) dioxygenase a [Danio rerio]